MLFSIFLGCCVAGHPEHNTETDYIDIQYVSYHDAPHWCEEYQPYHSGALVCDYDDGWICCTRDVGWECYEEWCAWDSYCEWEYMSNSCVN